jgi:micrococcal nuclease
MKKMMMMVAGLLVSMVAFAKEEITGRVVSVIDGNTVEMVGEDNETYKIMLQGIDCPELNQDYGDAAKQYLEKMVMGKEVHAQVTGKNRYGVRQAIVLVGDVDPRQELLKEGLAWTSEVDPIPSLEDLKDKAKQRGKGLWKENDPTPPWVFRRQQTRLQFKSS